MKKNKKAEKLVKIKPGPVNKFAGAGANLLMGNRNNNKLSKGGSRSSVLKGCNSTGVKDRISALPDELLLDVLTRLTVKEAAITSTLSKRWRYLWRSHPILDLQCLRSFIDPATFKQTVNSILGQYNSPKLHEFVLHGVVPGNSNSCVDEWISFAINKGASKLELGVCLLPSPDNPCLYRVPVHLFGAKPVESLRHLCLSSVILSSEVFDIILTSCCHLECFSLIHIGGIVYAKNTTPHQNLKSIRFYLCNDLEMVELWAPNLSSFNYHGRQRTISIKDCKQLLNLRLTSAPAFDSHPSMVCPKVFVCQLSSYLPTLEYLVIDADLFKNRSDFAELRSLSNLKKLVLDIGLSSPLHLGYKLAASMLRAAPHLRLLEIHIPPVDVHLNWKRRALKLASMSLHQNLEELKLTGFKGDVHTMEFVSYIAEYAAASLKKIDITPRHCVRRGDTRTLSSQLVWKEYEADICKEFVLQLRQRLPVNARLLFHDVDNGMQKVSCL